MVDLAAPFALCALVVLLDWPSCQSMPSETIQLVVEPEEVYSGTLTRFTCLPETTREIYDLRLNGRRISNMPPSAAFVCTYGGYPGTTNASIFSWDSEVSGCQNPMKNVTFSIQVTTLSEMYYSCAMTHLDKDVWGRDESQLSYLAIRVSPDTPTILPNQSVFNDGETLRISCYALKGRPQANISLQVTSNRSEFYYHATGSEIASLSVNITRLYHLATVTCTVTNHPSLSLTSRKQIMINHIYAKESIVRIPVQGTEVMVQCNSYIETFPPASYIWSVPKEFATAKDSDYVIETEEAGLSFVCIATNPATSSSVSVMFLTTHNYSDAKHNASMVGSEELEARLIVIPAVVISITLVVVITAGFIVYCRRQSHKRLPKSHQNGRVTAQEPVGQQKINERNSTTLEEDDHLYEDVDEYTTCGTFAETNAPSHLPAARETVSYMSLHLTSALPENEAPHVYRQLE